MESPPVVGRPAMAHLCNVAHETLCTYVDAADEIKTLCIDLLTLQKLLSLIDRVFKARLPRMPFEEQHFTSVNVLLDRCRATLSRLCEIFTPLESNGGQARSKLGVQEALKNMRSSETIALRAKVDFYIQTLQMSLQTVKL